MKSIKPGRGPSAMGAIGSAVVGLFGVFWTIGAASMGAPTFFVLFGVVFVGLAVIQALYHFKNATGKNRMSMFDITDNHVEPDPLNQYIYKTQRNDHKINEKLSIDKNTYKYCPYCGNQLKSDMYKYCPSCGKAIRENK